MKTFFGRVIAVVFGITLFIIGCFIVISILGSILGGADKVTVDSGSVLKLDFKEPIYESNMEIQTSLFNLTEKESPNLLQILNAIENAKEDDNIKGISLELNTTTPEEITQIDLIRDKIQDFKSSGKFVYAYTNRASQADYYLATVADSIFHNPLGSIDLKGLSSEVMFFKNFGEKYGIEFEIIRHGDYKSAVEPFLRDNLSDENREQLTQIVTQIWDGMTTKMSDSRNISTEQLNQYTDSLVAFNAKSALSHKLVDALYQESEYHEFLKSKLNIDDDKKLKSIEIKDYATTLKNKFESDKIAVLYAHGTIMPGDSQFGIQSETYKEAIQKIAKDDKIKAVVLRVNSGGGDANTSEEILHEMRKLHAKKPVVVSFGEVAASGGYYIAMDSDKIFAEPYTITGSIGVLGMIPNIKGLANNNGFTTDYVKTNENTIYYSPFQGLSKGGLETITKSTESIYEIFVNHVAANRNRSFEEIDALGGGRIYTGTEAKKLGLVDELGSLQDAISYAAEVAEIKDYQLKSYPQKKTDLETLMKELNLSTEVKAQIQNSMDPALLKTYIQIDQMRKLNGVQVLWPYDLNIR
ncbi:signal peptide peptidase SppA [Weeksellaceae bacterium KMM 9713]|uniref:Signal peptide peptidase SppA n=1 Tax=Profundicola chukchiensis TaxID=2961959 RepID=A0A9X4MVM4_9FLAO|nr:signal peptide peptidase SppA [Profundicola chukchiensis]MDG4945683.1 signal peptide peptidase SppA [Profundicola chukchiensis]